MHHESTIVSSYHIVGTEHHPSAPGLQQADPHHRSVIAPRAVRSVTNVWTILGAVSDLLAAMMALCFLVFGIVVAYTNDRSVETAPWIPAILSATQLGPTIFPILFAAIAGRYLKSVASWKVERGATIGSLEQLLGSRTLISTVLLQIHMRAFNVLGIALVALWALSPLGGQAALRVARMTPSEQLATQDITYVDFTSPLINNGPGKGDFIDVIDGIFVAELLSPTVNKLSPMDTWGNVRIPMLESLEGYSEAGGKEEEKWLKIDPSKNTTWSSLTGVPHGPRYTGTTENRTFHMETAYWVTSCEKGHYELESLDASWREYGPGERNATGFWHSARNWNWFRLETERRSANPYLLQYEKYVYENVTQPLPDHEFKDDRNFTWLPSKPRILNIETPTTNGSLYSFTCTLTTSYVEVEVSCIENACSAASMRRSLQPHNSTNWSTLDFIPLTGAMSFYDRFINATRPVATDRSTAAEAYLTNPYTPYMASYADGDVGTNGSGLGSSWIDVGAVNDASAIGTRLSQLLNTYWLANIAPTAVTGVLLTDADNYYKGKIIPSTTHHMVNTTAHASRALLVLRYDLPWLFILFLASAALTLCALASLFFNLRRQGPDILESFSSLTRDNPYILTMTRTATATQQLLPIGGASGGGTSGSSLDGVERARFLKDVKVILADVAVDDPVGHIALTTVLPASSGGGDDRDATVGFLRKGRLYD